MFYICILAAVTEKTPRSQNITWIHTWIKYCGPFEVCVLLWTQIQTPKLFEAGLEFADTGYGGLLPLHPRALLAVQENLFQHAVSRAVHHLKVHTLLGQAQNKERCPAAFEKWELVVWWHLVKSRQVPHELYCFNQNCWSFFANLWRPFQAHRPPQLTVASVRYWAVVEAVLARFAVIHLAQDVEEDGIRKPVAVGRTMTPAIHF